MDEAERPPRPERLQDRIADGMIAASSQGDDTSLSDPQVELVDRVDRSLEIENGREVHVADVANPLPFEWILPR
jgi:hypothetical protein